MRREIRLRPISLRYYKDDRVKTFWLHEDVRDSFEEAIAKWLERGGNFRVTETLRTVAQQKILKQKKPTLASAPGWSLHAHGRAVDFSVKSVGDAKDLLRFYEHMSVYGWWTIFNTPTKPIRYQSREAWHLQKTDPPGISAKQYLRAWCEGRVEDLLNIVYKKILDK